MVSIWTKAASELVGSWWALTFGTSLTANVCLRGTKGERMGFGFVGLFYGLSFFFPILCLDNVSAALNPAVMLANWVLGRASGEEFLLFSLAELAGCFLGGVTGYLIHLGQFRMGVKKPVSLSLSSLSTVIPPPSQSDISVCLELSKDEAGGRGSDLPFIPLPPVREDGRRMSEREEEKKKREAQPLSFPPREQGMTDGDFLLSLRERDPSFSSLSPEEWEYVSLVYKDQAGKLSSFSTRPEIYHWAQNLITEMLGTMFLVVGANSAGDLSLLLPTTSLLSLPLLYRRVFFAFFLSSYIGLCVSALGGPTGFAANPARDLGPRLSFFVLPIKGKGRAEWEYAWVPVVGPFLGALLGAAVYEGTRRVMIP